MELYHGIDISKHNGIIDFKKLTENNKIDFAMIRAGYGEDIIDSMFCTNADKCIEYKIPFGVYWFSYAFTVDMAITEAQFCKRLANNYNLQYPIAFDFEYDSVIYAKKNGVTMTKELASAIILAFCSEMEKAGFYCMVYANRDYLKNYITPEIIAKFDLWYAGWYKTYDLNAPPLKCGIWQYTSKGDVCGISGNVDLNVSYKNYPAIIQTLNSKKGKYMTVDYAKQIVKNKLGVSDDTIKYLCDLYKHGDELIIKIATGLK